MANQVLFKESTGAGTIGAPGVRRRGLLMLGVVAVAVVVILLSTGITADSGATNAVGAGAVQSQALEAHENPGLTRGAAADAARLTALAATYGDYRILTPSRRAERDRWQAMANYYTRSNRSLAAETARLSGLAEHYLGLSAPQRAAADRYQGMADALNK